MSFTNQCYSLQRLVEAVLSSVKPKTCWCTNPFPKVMFLNTQLNKDCPLNSSSITSSLLLVPSTCLPSHPSSSFDSPMHFNEAALSRGSFVLGCRHNCNLIFLPSLPNCLLFFFFFHIPHSDFHWASCFTPFPPFCEATRVFLSPWTPWASTREKPKESKKPPWQAVTLSPSEGRHCRRLHRHNCVCLNKLLGLRHTVLLLLLVISGEKKKKTFTVVIKQTKNSKWTLNFQVNNI